MRSVSIVGRFSSAVALAVLLAACDKAPTGPSTSTSSATPITGPTITRVEIVSPGSASVPDTTFLGPVVIVAPGDTVQLAAFALFSDGSRRDVTNEAAWTSTDPRILSISNTGLATAHQTGEIGIRATVNGTEGHRGVLTLPAGTYKVAGSVEEGEVPVPDARVEVTGGPATGLSSVTRPFPGGGSYTLLGVSGDTQFRVTKDGYQPLVRTLRVADHQRINFELMPLAPRVHVSGTYVLTISASADCRSVLPEDVRTQTYTAVLTQDGARVTVTLSGANFVRENSRTYNTFDGTVEPNLVRFLPRNFVIDFIDSLSTSFSDMFVQLTPSTYLAVSAWPHGAMTTVSSAGLSGTLHGAIETVQRIGPGALDWRIIASCSAPSHEFVFSRRGS
jgi:Bacterial Ig-like domain (group 2)